MKKANAPSLIGGVFALLVLNSYVEWLERNLMQLKPFDDPLQFIRDILHTRR